MTRRDLINALLVSSAFGLGGCMLRETETIRYRITVEVDTPRGLRTGSSVWQVKALEGLPMSNSGVNYEIEGEAVAVDLPGGGKARLSGCIDCSSAAQHRADGERDDEHADGDQHLRHRVSLAERTSPTDRAGPGREAAVARRSPRRP